MKNKIKYTNLQNVNEKGMELLNKLANKPNGTFLKIQYYTDCNSQVAARFKGTNVTKLTTMSVRKGIKYENIKQVKEIRSDVNYTPSDKKPWFHHADESNFLLKHNNKEEYYVALFPNPKGRAKTQYFVNGLPISKETLQENGIMQPSFWTKKETKPLMMTLGVNKLEYIF